MGIIDGFADALFPPLMLIQLITRTAMSPIDALSDAIEDFILTPDLINVEDKGDYIIKTYVYRRARIKPEFIDKLALKLDEALSPPLRNPYNIKILEIKPLEKGALTEDVLVKVAVPKYGLLSRSRKELEKLKEKIKEIEHRR